MLPANFMAEVDKQEKAVRVSQLLDVLAGSAARSSIMLVSVLKT